MSHPIYALFFYLLSISFTFAAAKPHLVVFGCELSDIGNLKNLESDYSLWNGRFSNGPAWNEYLSFYKDYTLINYAHGGAVLSNMVQDTSVYTYTRSGQATPTIQKQTQRFIQTFGTKFNADSIKNDVIFFETSIGDIFLNGMSESNSQKDWEAISLELSYKVVGLISNFKSIGYTKFLVSDYHESALAEEYWSSLYNGGQSLKNIISVSNNALSKTLAENFSNSDSDFVRIVSFHDIVELATSELSDNLGIKVLDDGCAELIDGSTHLTCDNPDEHFFMSYSPSTKVHALFGAVAANIIDDPSFTINKSNVMPLINKYNISNVSGKSNFLYLGNSESTGAIRIQEFTAKSAAEQANTIISEKNRKATSSSTSCKISSPNAKMNLLHTIILSSIVYLMAYISC